MTMIFLPKNFQNVNRYDDYRKTPKEFQTYLARLFHNMTFLTVQNYLSTTITSQMNLMYGVLMIIKIFKEIRPLAEGGPFRFVCCSRSSSASDNSDLERPFKTIIYMQVLFRFRTSNKNQIFVRN